MGRHHQLPRHGAAAAATMSTAAVVWPVLVLLISCLTVNVMATHSGDSAQVSNVDGYSPGQPLLSCIWSSEKVLWNELQV